MQLHELINHGGHQLRMAHIPAPVSEAELLLAHAIGKPKEYLLTHPETNVSKIQAEAYETLIQRRSNNEPVAYLLGYKDFYGRSFLVDRHVLIPRPETETLIESALEELKGIDPERITVLDIGTGSGAIALTLAAELPGCRAIGIDKSQEAVTVAQKNAKHLELQDRVSFKVFDIGIPGKVSPLQNGFDYLVMTANLPYLTFMSWEHVAPSIRDYEPIMAFVSGSDGLNHYRALMRRLKEWELTPNLALFEADPPQFFPLAKIVQSRFPEHRLRIQLDLAGNDRILVAKKDASKDLSTARKQKETIA